ncbi:MAG: hypothetical protein CL843_01425 [Crocinitomicaceae bacterium]|nr:hypothetical protein [Crocinitomicaceae bacterium]|tara:strand:+ start:13592 stop:14605 length:1014 start_codon:yes stop_codon:yes gene_type:complete
MQSTQKNSSNNSSKTVLFFVGGLSLLSLLFSCQKEEASGTTTSGACTPLPATPDYGWVYESKYSEILHRITTSPFNNNELLISTEISNDDSTSGNIYKYNLNTKKLTLVANKYVNSTPQWNTNDQVVFTTAQSGFSLFYMNSDGSGLTQVPEYFNIFDPVWSYDNTKIYFYDFNLSFQCVKADLSGNRLDTLNCPYILGLDFFDDKECLIYYPIEGGQFSIYNFDTNTIRSTGDQLPDYPIAWFEVNDDNPNQFVFQNNQGLYIYNLSSHTNTTIVDSCDRKKYFCPTYNKDHTYIYAIEGQYGVSENNSGTLTVEDYIVKISPNGGVVERFRPLFD